MSISFSGLKGKPFYFIVIVENGKFIVRVENVQMYVIHTVI